MIHHHGHWSPNYGGLLWMAGVGLVMSVVCLIAIYLKRRR